MSWRALVARRPRATMVVVPCAVAGWLVLAAAAFSATVAGADAGSTTGATAAAQPQPAKTAKFEAFVKQVGLDMSSVPVELRREWASAPRVGIDDCGVPGTHAGHSHGPDRGGKGIEHPDAIEQRSDP